MVVSSGVFVSLLICLQNICIYTFEIIAEERLSIPHFKFCIGDLCVQGSIRVKTQSGDEHEQFYSGKVTSGRKWYYQSWLSPMFSFDVIYSKYKLTFKGYICTFS